MPLSLLRFAPWAIAGLAVLAALWFRGSLEHCRAQAAIEAAKAEEAVRKARDADATLTRALAEQASQLKIALQEQSNAAFSAIARAKSDPNCARTPAAGAFDAGVLNGGQQAGPRPPGPARP